MSQSSVEAKSQVWVGTETVVTSKLKNTIASSVTVKQLHPWPHVEWLLSTTCDSLEGSLQ